MTLRTGSSRSAAGRLALPILALAAFAGPLGFLACTSEQIGQSVEVGMIAAGKPPEQAQAAGQAARGTVGYVEPISFETERAIGGGIAVEAFARMGQLVDDPGLQRYVNLVGRAVSRQSSRPEIPWSFAVIESDAPNAFAGSGGYVFVTTGALRLMDNESELAGVLAHEVAHVTQQHILQVYRRQNLFGGLQAAAQAKNPDDAAKYNELIDVATDSLFDKGLDQGLEYEADLVGVEVAALAGYDPNGIVTFLQAMKHATGMQGGWFTTHPDLDSRIEKLNYKIGVDLGGMEGAIQRERFQQMVAGRLGGG